MARQNPPREVKKSSKSNPSTPTNSAPPSPQGPQTSSAPPPPQTSSAPPPPQALPPPSAQVPPPSNTSVSGIVTILSDHTLSATETEQQFQGLDIKDGTSLSILLAIKQVLQGLESVKSDLADEREKVKTLETTVATQLDYICDLENRLNQSDAYSGRSTVILSNIPEEENEQPDSLAERVSNLTGVALPDIGHVHRNKKRRPGKPRTVTLQLIRAHDKDKLFRRKKQLADQRKIGLYHHMTPALIKTKDKLESLKGVKWVAYGGHSRMFTVNYDENQICTKVLSVSDFLDRDVLSDHA